MSRKGRTTSTQPCISTSDLKSRLIPTRHHSALLAFVTANAAEMEEHGLTVNSSLEHNTISLNTDDRREDYHMMKIEL